MKWSKPKAVNTRFGFEVTMYVYIMGAIEQPKELLNHAGGLKAVQSNSSTREEKDNETV